MSGRRNQRRRLAFRDLFEVLADVERLRKGHQTIGRWSLAQICRHLSDSINASIDGLDLRRHRIKRFFLARPMLWATLRFGIPPGYTVDPKLAPPAGVNLDEAVEGLRRAVHRYTEHRGELRSHPLFGRLPRKVWDRFHCFHCGHHLSFAVPAPETEPQESPSPRESAAAHLA